MFFIGGGACRAGLTWAPIGTATWESAINSMKGQQRLMAMSSSSRGQRGPPIGGGAQQRLEGGVWGGGERERQGVAGHARFRSLTRESLGKATCFRVSVAVMKPHD